MGESEREIRLPAGEALGLAELVEYADDSVVSRTLAETRGATVTAFAFDKGQSLSEHTTPFDALVHVLEGKARLTIGGRAVNVSGGEVVLMPAHVPHAVQAPERFKMLLVMLR